MDGLAKFAELWRVVEAMQGSRSGGMNFYVDEDGATVQETWEARSFPEGKPGDEPFTLADLEGPNEGLTGSGAPPRL
jgi:hypothetical protein